MFQRIPAPLDGSQVVSRGLRPALTLDGMAGGEVLFVRASNLADVSAYRDPDPTLLYPDPSLDCSEKLYQEYLAGMQGGLSQPGLDTRAEGRWGRAAETVPRLSLGSEHGGRVASSGG